MTRQSLRMHSVSGLRASLIRVNPCRFSDRYAVTSKCPVGEGTFGQVHCCVDKLARASRAVKRISMPEDQQQRAVLRGEVAALVALDHPHIVRLIEYFVECDEVLLVMELLEGPSLGERMQEVGRFSEEAAAHCLRHMLKALFCCHCQGFAHNDVSRENFKFATPHPSASLKMLDFGLSGSSEGQAFPAEAEHGHFAQECDVWRAGVILFVMLSGAELFPACSPGRPSEQLVAGGCDPACVPAGLQALDASPEALGLLHGVLEPSAGRRLPAREALMHPFITRFHQPREGGQGAQDGEGWARPLRRFVAALAAFHRAARVKRLALLIAAHLLTNNCDAMAAIHRLFRRLVRDGRRVEERALRAALASCGIEAPEDLGAAFGSADLAGKGGLDYIEFVAVAIIAEPRLYCRELMLRAVFRFLDASDVGSIDDEVLRSLFDLPMCSGGAPVREACGQPCMAFAAFRALMVPEGWDEGPPSGTPAPWAEQPDAPRAGAGLPGAPGPPRGNPVRSLPSSVFAVRQAAGFHAGALRPFYAAQPVSNVVLGIVRGTSRYARGAARRGLAELLPLGGPGRGAFFLMPNPKYHWRPEDVELADAPPRLRLVAWWIHPGFLGELSAWLDRCAGSLPGSPVLRPQPGPGQELELGAPGDFGFSEVGKPAGYLHTYRDLAGRADLEMLEALVDGVGSTLERLLGAALPLARVSVGFHYPVRPQYSTLHLQVRVNAGDVCDGKERRGVDLFQLLARLRADPDALSRDDEPLQYQATSNLRVALMAAAAAAGREGREVAPEELLLD